MDLGRGRFDFHSYEWAEEEEEAAERVKLMGIFGERGRRTRLREGSLYKSRRDAGDDIASRSSSLLVEDNDELDVLAGWSLNIRF